MILPRCSLLSTNALTDVLRLLCESKPESGDVKKESVRKCAKTVPTGYEVP